MKQSPLYRKIQTEMMSGRYSAYNFLGNDSRSLTDIIRDDGSVLERLGISSEVLADRMLFLSETASIRMGETVVIDNYIEVYSEDNRGRVPCPFSDGFFALKRVTYVKNIRNGENIKWSDLNIHMIREHCFFEGRESDFRINPEKLFKIIF